jgi:hypothetical protein
LCGNADHAEVLDACLHNTNHHVGEQHSHSVAHVWVPC